MAHNLKHLLTHAVGYYPVPLRGAKINDAASRARGIAR